MRSILKISVAILVVAIAGCSKSNTSQSVYDKEITVVKSTVVKDATIAQAMEESRLVLTDMGFRLEKFDTELGYLRSKPLGGKQLWQFWRHDNVGYYNEAMSNINCIARIVEMNFKAVEASVYVDCQATVKKLSFVGNEVTGVSDMRSAFNDTSGGHQQLSLEGGEAKWLDLGRDVMLEEKVLQSIRVAW